MAKKTATGSGEQVKENVARRLKAHNPSKTRTRPKPSPVTVIRQHPRYIHCAVCHKQFFDRESWSTHFLRSHYARTI